MDNKFVRRDELIVSGYIHASNMVIPTEIIQLCLKWYHIALFWEYFPSIKGYTINDDKTSIKYVKCSDPPFISIYGSIIMPSMNNNSIYEYGIKLDGKMGVVIGICDAEFTDTETFFYNRHINKSKCYGLYGWDGHTISPYIRYAHSFNYNKHETNEVKLIYDAGNSTLSYQINDTDHGIACNIDKSEELKYRLAIHLGLSGFYGEDNEMTVELNTFKELIADNCL